MGGASRHWQVIDRRLAVLASGIAVTLLLTIGLTGTDSPALVLPFAHGDGEVRAERAYGELPLAFEPNAGRTDAGVDYIAHSASGTTFLSGSGATIELSDGKSTEALGLGLVGASSAQPVGVERLPGVVNDLRGNRPSRWVTDIPTFERVRYPGVYPGIDVDWYGSRRQLEYDFRLAAGADPGDIAIRFTGAHQVRLAPNGDLVVKTAGEQIRQRAPIAYQPSPRGRIAVRSAFELRGDVVSFRLGAYDRQRRLVIDPVVLSYSTFLGGLADDVALEIALDSAGAAYLTGTTQSSGFPTTPGAFDTSDHSSIDAFVTKLNPAGSALSYSTFLGGSGGDVGEAIAVDSSGAAYVTGSTSSSGFPTTPGALDTSYNDLGDAFATKLNPAGSGLSYSTFLGGSQNDQGLGMTVDSAGAAYLTGDTASDGVVAFPTTPGAFNTSGGGVFATKLNPAGSALSYSTFLGGGQGFEIAVDSAGAAYVTGGTSSSVFPTTAGAFDTSHNGGEDAFATKLNPAGSALSYSTFLGGSGADDGRGGVAVDSAGAAYVTGGTSSSGFPTTAGAIDTTYNLAGDAFVAKMDPAGSALSYSTFLGGSDRDDGSGVAVDSAGTVYLTGTTNSSGFPTTAGALDTSYNEGGDAFAAKLMEVPVPPVPPEEPTAGDADPPETTIVKGPKTKTKKKKATFEFISSEPGSAFECKLDGGQFQSCTAPFEVKVKTGKHTFSVRATDPAGNADPTPATRSWKVRKKK